MQVWPQRAFDLFAARYEEVKHLAQPSVGTRRQKLLSTKRGATRGGPGSDRAL